MKTLVSGFLALSLGLNIFLWRQFARERNELETAQAGASESAALRQQTQEVQADPNTPVETANADALELPRLRNEVSQLRKQAVDTALLRAQAVETAQLRARLAVATQDLARAESDLAEVVRIPPEQLQAAKEEAQSIACVNNLKQIGLAARLWAHDHNDVFPPDFLSMKDELNTPKILFCPADPTGVRVTEWSQLNVASISYRFLNPNGNETDPSKLLSTCPIHGHIGRSDGSVQRKQ
jgi:hypothetical protein